MPFGDMLAKGTWVGGALRRHEASGAQGKLPGRGELS